MTLILSIAALLLGPLIYAVGRKNKIARKLLDGLVLLSIAVIIFVHIIPGALAQGGAIAIVVIILGIAFPMLLERLFRKAADTAHLMIVAIAAIGLIVHAVIDGLALLPGNSVGPGSGVGLAHAIILHRLPVGMAIWWVVRPGLGTPVAVGIFALVIIATATGYLMGETVVQMVETQTLALFQAFVSGSLIHIVIFGIKHDAH
jgi:zinc transporter ZupT